MHISISTAQPQKQIRNFWNHIHFHPTDAIEDAWGKRILDSVYTDHVAKTIRMYSMFEDIVTMDENGMLSYDFRLNDLRLDYMVEHGFTVLLCYNFIPACIASNQKSLSNVTKNKTRYKGKMINTSHPTDYRLWEEICYQYTAHIIARYGEETVAGWHLQCYNEPDIPQFFLTDLGKRSPENTVIRLREYCKLYRAFEAGIRRASTKMCIGGPSVAVDMDFLEGLFQFIRENNLQYDFVSIHNYSQNAYSVEKSLETTQNYLQMINKYGMQDKMLIMDEWGARGSGFANIEDYPELIFREDERYAAFYFRLIYRYLQEQIPMDKMLICLSGQHEMEFEFTGFRGFFTLSSFPKPIYNAFALASHIREHLLSYTQDTPCEDLSIIPTCSEDGTVSVALSYGRDPFISEEDLPDLHLTLTLDNLAGNKKMKTWIIDKEHANGYRKYQAMGCPEPLTREHKQEIMAAAKLSCEETAAQDTVSLTLSPYSTVLLEFVP